MFALRSHRKHGQDQHEPFRLCQSARRRTLRQSDTLALSVLTPHLCSSWPRTEQPVKRTLTTSSIRSKTFALISTRSLINFSPNFKTLKVFFHPNKLSPTLIMVNGILSWLRRPVTTTNRSLRGTDRQRKHQRRKILLPLSLRGSGSTL